MVLTPEQQAELAALQEEAKKPEPRTDTGLVGILHALIDSASGVVAHRSDGDWAALQSQAEALAPPAPEPAPPAGTETYGFAG